MDTGLLYKLFDARTRREHVHFETIGVLSDYVERLSADRTGRTDYSYVFYRLCHFQVILTANLRQKREIIQRPDEKGAFSTYINMILEEVAIAFE